MKTVLVSVISDQTTSNVLLIRELKGQYDELLFIATNYTEQKGLRKWNEQ